MRRRNDFWFRAWDKSGGEVMLDVHAIDFYNRRIKYGPDDDQWRSWDDSDDLVLMQSTGLNDKNGVEIFEGDILGGDDGGVVYYAESVTSFMVECVCHYPSGDPSTFPSVPEVIGNVWENPELLEQSEQ